MITQKPVVKVCGMKDAQNIQDIAALQPSMMGFIFYSPSKRFVGEDFDMPVIANDIEKVAVFVNERPASIIGILQKYSFRTAQLHGNERPADCQLIKDAGFKVMKAFGIDGAFNWNDLQPYIPVTDGFVFDTKTPTHGGSGVKFNWEILKAYTLHHPFLLSGGIKPEDAEALKDFFHPQCIGFDINSGFEVSAGLKDVEKVRLFMEGLRFNIWLSKKYNQ